MLTVVFLLVLSCATAGTADTCHEQFTCHWEGDVFVLRCQQTNDTVTAKTAVVTTTDVPVIASRLKIVCDHQHVDMQLGFANLYDVTDLTLEGAGVNATGSNIFHGVSNLSSLVLRNLHWKSIDYDCFESLTNLRLLTLDHLGRLEFMHPDALTPLVSLESLSFLYIDLPYGGYISALRGIVSSTFHALALHGIDSSDPGVDMIPLFRNWTCRATLKKVDLVNNRLRMTVMTNIGQYWLWPQLEHLSLTGNLITTIPVETPFSLASIISDEHLKTIYVTGVKNSIAQPGAKPLCAISVSTNVSNLYHPQWPIKPVELGSHLESISFNGAKYIIENIGLPEWVFTLQYPEGEYGIHINDSRNVLKYLDLSSFQTTPCVTMAFVGCHALEYFNIQNIRSIEPIVFHQMTNLTVLLLGNNDLGNVVADDTESSLFSENKKLKILDLSGCQLTAIPPDEFSVLQDLQQLNLSRNSLEQFQVDLQNLNEFQFLNLSENKLRTLAVAMRVQLDQMAADRNMQVDISGNPLECTCNDTEFVSWIHKSRVIFENKHNTHCTDGNNNLLHLFVLDSDELERVCNPDRYMNATTGSTEVTVSNNHKDKDNAYVTILLPTMIVFVFVSAMLFMAYKCRWKFAVAWNRFRKYTKFTNVDLNEVVYERDAFICYNSSDSGWVCHDLLDHLDSSGISTVIHHRDFLPGSVLEETIRESIDRSRFTVLVLSPDFLDSNWCRLEMHVARNRIISEGRDVIVPIILREFPTSQVTRTLAGILSKSYLQWTDDPEGQALFWDKLITKLKHGGNLKPLEN